jgi:hypothetical protein
MAIMIGEDQDEAKEIKGLKTLGPDYFRNHHCFWLARAILSMPSSSSIQVSRFISKW